MTTFKVGDLVRIKDRSLGQPDYMCSNILPIERVDTENIIRIKDTKDKDILWAYHKDQVELVEGEKPKQPQVNTYKFRFTMPDEKPGIVDVVIRGNTTQVTIIVNPQDRYNGCNKGKQFFTGLAFCNPCDKFDITTGIKEACKKALELDPETNNWYYVPDGDYRRAIYSSIRKVTRGTK